MTGPVGSGSRHPVPLPRVELELGAGQSSTARARANAAMEALVVTRARDALTAFTPSGQRSFMQELFPDGPGSPARQLPIERVAVIARALAAALAPLHEGGGAHGGIEPEAIRFADGGRLTLARVSSMLAPLIDADGRTIQYRAPEVLARLALPITPSTDVYALAVTVYEALTGRLPWDAVGPADQRTMLARAMHGAPVPPGAHMARLDPEVERSLMRALRHDPAARPSSMDELVAALEHAAARHVAGMVNPPSAWGSSTPIWWWMAAVAMGALILDRFL